VKICVPVERNDGIKSKVYGHFGSSPFFALYDTDSKKLEIIDNSQKEHEHGSCNPVKAFEEKKIDAIFVSGIGRGAFEVLRCLGIKVYFAEERTIDELLSSIRTGAFKEVDASGLCKSHNCH
jgi:ArsR family transcriptional regulator